MSEKKKVKFIFETKKQTALFVASFMVDESSISKIKQY